MEEAIQKDSKYALAYAGLAMAHLVLTTSYVAPLEGMPKVKAAAMKTIELDDTLAEAHAGYAGLLIARGLRDEAFRETKKHRYVCGYGAAAIYAALGEKEQALEWLERAYGERSD